MSSLITSIALDADTLDLSGGAGFISSTINITSTDQAISRIGIQWSAPDGNARVFVEYSVISVVDDVYTLQGLVTFGEYYAAGDWEISALSIIYSDGFTETQADGFSGDTLNALLNGIPESNTKINIINPKSDPILPELNGVRFSTTDVNTFTGEAKIGIEWSIGDNLSGVASYVAQVYDPNGNYYGSFIDSITLPAKSLEGEWTINNVTLMDNAGNELFVVDFPISFGPLSFSVSNVEPFNVGTATFNLSDILISGISATGTSKVESIDFDRVNINTGKGKPIWEIQKIYTLLNEFTNVDGITFVGGDSANNISGAGDSTLGRTAFDGQLIIKGELGIDSITGGIGTNLLQGGGIAAPGADATGLFDTLTGTTGAIDVFDLRTSNNQSDAYAAANSGYSVINNFNVGEDYILMANNGYSVNRIETTTGKGKKNKVTTYSFEIRSGDELVATIASSDFTSTSIRDNLGLTVSTGDPSSVLFGDQQQQLFL